MVKEATRDLKGVTCRVTTPLGVHQKLAEIILERAGL
jgi:hypothetical protein